jgi:hypothetical protein
MRRLRLSLKELLMSLVIRGSQVSAVLGPMAALGLMIGGCYDDEMFAAPPESSGQSSDGGAGQGGSGEGGSGGSAGAGVGGGGVSVISVSGKYPDGADVYEKGDEILGIGWDTLITGQFPPSDVVSFQLNITTKRVVHIGTYDSNGACGEGFDTALVLTGATGGQTFVADDNGTPCAALTSPLTEGTYNLSVFNKSGSPDKQYILEVWFPSEVGENVAQEKTFLFEERHTLIFGEIDHVADLFQFEPSRVQVAAWGENPHSCRSFDGKLFLLTQTNNSEAVIPGGYIQISSVQAINRIQLQKNESTPKFAYKLLVTRQKPDWVTSWQGKPPPSP